MRRKVFLTATARKALIRELADAQERDFELRGILSAQNKSYLKRVKDDFGDFAAAALTAERIDRYIEERRAHGYAAASINRVTQMLGQCYQLAIRRGTLARAPYIRRLSEADNVRQGFFSEQELRDTLAALPNDGLRDFVEWAAATGQRRGEIESLTFDMLHGQELHVPGPVTKNRKPRIIPLGPELAAIIDRRKTARRIELAGVVSMSKYIFHRGDGLRVGDFKKSWRTATKAAKCPGRLFHYLRRFSARTLLAQASRKRSRSRLPGIARPACFSGTPSLTPRKCSTHKRKLRSSDERRNRNLPLSFFGHSDRFSDVWPTKH